VCKKKYLRFKDLKERGICGNWTTLMRWIRERGFPAGVMLGPNTRAFPEDEIDAWLANLPKGDES
jgi:predicted DNA-binding transcriptional regulator AlpA